MGSTTDHLGRGVDVKRFLYSNKPRVKEFMVKERTEDSRFDDFYENYKSCHCDNNDS